MWKKWNSNKQTQISAGLTQDESDITERRKPLQFHHIQTLNDFYEHAGGMLKPQIKNRMKRGPFGEILIRCFYIKLLHQHHVENNVQIVLRQFPVKSEFIIISQFNYNFSSLKAWKEEHRVFKSVWLVEWCKLQFA